MYVQWDPVVAKSRVVALAQISQFVVMCLLTVASMPSFFLLVFEIFGLRTQAGGGGGASDLRSTTAPILGGGGGSGTSDPP